MLVKCTRGEGGGFFVFNDLEKLQQYSILMKNLQNY
jgi:hypothetical protein